MTQYRIKLDIKVQGIDDIYRIYDDIRWNTCIDKQPYRIAIYSVHEHKLENDVVIKEELIKADRNPR